MRMRTSDQPPGHRALFLLLVAACTFASTICQFKSNFKVQSVKKKSKNKVLVKLVLSFWLECKPWGWFVWKKKKKNSLSCSPSGLFQLPDCVRFLTPHCCIDSLYFCWRAQMLSTHSLNQPDRLKHMSARNWSWRISVHPEQTAALFPSNGGWGGIDHGSAQTAISNLFKISLGNLCMCALLSLSQECLEPLAWKKHTHTHTHARYTTWTLGRMPKSWRNVTRWPWFADFNMETGHSASEEEARIAAVSGNGSQTVCVLTQESLLHVCGKGDANINVTSMNWCPVLLKHVIKGVPCWRGEGVLTKTSAHELSYGWTSLPAFINPEFPVWHFECFFRYMLSREGGNLWLSRH